MYSVVLATMLTAGTATPDFFFAKKHAAPVASCSGCSGCYGCSGFSCGGCSGCSGYSCSGCGGCYGGYTRSYSCSGCYGCGGCSGCWGCGGCTGYSCGGCWGGCSGCYGYSSYSCSGCSGCYGCGGCSGVMASYASCSGFSACYGYSSGCFGGVIGTTPVISAPIGCIGGAPSIGGSIIIGSSAPVIGGTIGTPIVEAAGGIATVTLKAPTDAVIEVNGTTLARKGEEQTFNTPNLSATGKHTYDFVATLTRDGKSAKRTRTIEVRPGGEVNVDFSELVAELNKNQSQDRARVLVALPQDAELFVDGMKMSATGANRKFQTPMLDTGKSFSYELRATMSRDGQLHESIQKVRVEAGKEVNVEFSETSFVKVNNKVASR